MFQSTTDATAAPRPNDMVLSKLPSPLPAGADEHMDAEELAILAELNEQFPEGAVEADLDHWPAYDRWPAWVSNHYWSDGKGGAL